MSNKAVGKALRLDAEAVKELDKQYMRQQLARHPVVAPRVIGVDELSIKRGHKYLCDRF